MQRPNDLHEYLVSLGASVTLLEKAERRRLEQEWLHAFCSNAKRNTGKWVYHGYRWHAFSFGYEEAKRGRKALQIYSSLHPRRLFVFSDWGPEIGLVCDAIPPPDLTGLHSDFFVFPPNLLWTMSFTHEQPDLGPYFACRDWDALDQEESGQDTTDKSA